MKLSFEVLQVLDAVDKAGTFAKAAETMNRVPSALTYLIQKLEEDLGIELFDRSKRRAQLTHTGRVVVEEGRRLLRAADDLERKAKRIQQGWETELRVGVDEIIPFDFVWDTVSGFFDLHTDTRLSLTKEVLGGSWDALVTRRVDLIIGAAGEAPQIPNLVVRPIGTLKHVFVVEPNHPLASMPDPLSLDTVARYRAVAIADTSRVLAPRSVAIVPGQDVLTVPTLDAKLVAQLRGIAVGTIPECLAAGLVNRGKLVKKQVGGMREVTQFYLAWREDEAGSALRWWVEQFDNPNLMERVAMHHIARS
jgi:DNA-binding transcriptional LysR family regulator